MKNDFRMIRPNVLRKTTDTKPNKGQRSKGAAVDAFAKSEKQRDPKLSNGFEVLNLISGIQTTLDHSTP